MALISTTATISRKPSFFLEHASSHLIDDQLALFAREKQQSPAYKEITSPSGLQDVSQVADDLRKIDWAFTADDTSYLTHDIHPYPAKFIPQIPGHLIARLSLRGEVVLDPFGGSGTTALEAIRLGRRAITIDANPIGTLIGRVKISRLDKRTLTDLYAIRSYLMTRLSSLSNDPADLMNEFRAYIPEIPNRQKWFPDTSCGELAMIRAHIKMMESEIARDIASLTLSRIVLKVSFQDSETRYASRPREIKSGETIQRFLQELEIITTRVAKTDSDLRYGVANFIIADTRKIDEKHLPTESIDLIVTSPPYGNATDYHLYHRFRLLWLGFDPRMLADIEIGSHLRHQRESNGFDAYLADMTPCLKMMERVLKPGRYAALIIGDAIYDGKLYAGADAIAERAGSIGLETVSIIHRPIHKTKRSFLAAGRRADEEKILVLKKPSRNCLISFELPPYKLWDYEERIRVGEIEKLIDSKPKKKRKELMASCSSYELINARRLAFSHSIRYQSGYREKTWQAILENGLANTSSQRKDPKYITHGLHPYKGKFYPQLAKCLINLSGIGEKSTVLDPFCGSGTTLLECYLNGLKSYGCDMHPLAVKIARAKVGILEAEPSIVLEAITTLLSKLEDFPSQLPSTTEQFADETIEEIYNWFAEPVVIKLNWLLRTIRSISADTIRDFMEVILSSIIREVSQQDPNDLRIRRRKKPLKDADVFGLFHERLSTQYQRILHFWSIRGYSPFKFVNAHVCEGDSRLPATFSQFGLKAESVDLILTSPPYATALPYIDTDRLSLLVLFGMSSSYRRQIEHALIGSREITNSERDSWEELISEAGQYKLPHQVLNFTLSLHSKVLKADVGFRRRNVPALLFRFFSGMEQVLSSCYKVLKPGGTAMIVIGDNVTTIDNEVIHIPTTIFIKAIGESVGFKHVESLPITVTKENLIHMRNSIVKNVVLRLTKPL